MAPSNRIGVGRAVFACKFLYDAAPGKCCRVVARYGTWDQGATALFISLDYLIP
jgi:hypothetical protein